jgi:hypothetical protein
MQASHIPEGSSNPLAKSAEKRYHARIDLMS